MHRRKTECFEQFAFEAEIKAHPGERTIQCAFIDWLCERNFTLAGAKRRVAMLVRGELERRQVIRVNVLRDTDDPRWAGLLDNIRRCCNTHFLTTPELRIAPGCLRPTWFREGGRYRDSNGTEYTLMIRDEQDACDAVYVPTREVISVGAGWCLRVLGMVPEPLPG